MALFNTPDSLPTPSNPLAQLLQNYRIGIGQDPVDSAVLYAAVDLICSAAARILSTPGALFIVDQDRRRVNGNISNSVVNRLINSPDNSVSGYHWLRETFMEVIMFGNSYIEVTKTRNNNVAMLRRFLPDSVQISVNNNGVIQFAGRYARGRPRTDPVSSERVAHVASITLSPEREFPGFSVGRSPFSVLRPSLTIYHAVEQLIYDWYQTDGPLDHSVIEGLEQGFGNSKGVQDLQQMMVNYNTVLQPDQAVFNGVKGGSFSTWLPQVKATRVPSKIQDAMYKEHRENSIKEVSRLLHVPPMLLGSEASYVGSSIAEIFIGFWKFGIAPMVHNFTTSLSRVALPNNSFLMVDPTDFLRGTPASTAAMIAAMTPDAQRPGWATQAEVRRVAGLPADPDGEVLQGVAGSDEGNNNQQPDSAPDESDDRDELSVFRAIREAKQAGASR